MVYLLFLHWHYLGSVGTSFQAAPSGITGPTLMSAGSSKTTRQSATRQAT